MILLNGQEFAVKNQDDFTTAIDVLQTAAEYWRSHGKPFWILLYGHKDWNPDLPELPVPPGLAFLFPAIDLTVPLASGY
jgi:hypothetical protein